MPAHPLLLQPTTLLTISTCPGVSPTDRAQILPEDFLWALHAELKHMASFQRKTVKATGLNRSEKQEATFGTGLQQQSQQEGTKEEDNYVICSQIDLNPK